MSLQAARDATKLPIFKSVQLKKPVNRTVTHPEEKTLDELLAKVTRFPVFKKRNESKPITPPLLVDKPLSAETIVEYENHILYNLQKAEDHYWKQKDFYRRDFQEYEYQREREYADTAQAYRNAIKNSEIRKNSLTNFISVLNSVSERKKSERNEVISN